LWNKSLVQLWCTFCVAYFVFFRVCSLRRWGLLSLVMVGSDCCEPRCNTVSFGEVYLRCSGGLFLFMIGMLLLSCRLCLCVVGCRRSGGLFLLMSLGIQSSAFVPKKCLGYSQFDSRIFFLQFLLSPVRFTKSLRVRIPLRPPPQKKTPDSIFNAGRSKNT
jgi:hypothetical protein